MPGKVKTCRAVALLMIIMLCTAGITAYAAPGPAPDEAEMCQARERLEAERGKPHSFWTIEEQYAFQQAFLTYFVSTTSEAESWALATLPAEGELTQDAVIELAEAAVADKYGNDLLSPGVLRKDSVMLSEYSTGERIWTIEIFLYEHKETQAIASYLAKVDAKTGAVLAVDMVQDD